MLKILFLKEDLFHLISGEGIKSTTRRGTVINCGNVTRLQLLEHLFTYAKTQWSLASLGAAPCLDRVWLAQTPLILWAFSWVSFKYWSSPALFILLNTLFGPCISHSCRRADNNDSIFGPASCSCPHHDLPLSYVFQAPWRLMQALTRMPEVLFWSSLKWCTESSTSGN